MRTPLSSLLVWLTWHGLALPADQVLEPDLPRVLLVGDSIRLGYAATVEKELAGRAIVLSPKANGGDSSNVLKNLDEWVIRQRPNVVHFNCGIHDTKKSKKTGQFLLNGCGITKPDRVAHEQDRGQIGLQCLIGGQGQAVQRQPYKETTQWCTHG